MIFKMFLADGFEEIEAVTLIDLLRRADFDIKTVSINKSLEVKGAHDIIVAADEIFDDVDFDTVDALLLPGGSPGVPNLSTNQKVLDTVKKFFNEEKYLIAICAAPFVLEKAEILDGKKITCYPSWKDMIKSPEIVSDQVVVDGKIITAEGVGSAIDMGLKIVEIFSGKEMSEDLKEKIVYRK
ncbi:MAG: DJ-1/PfpI family protein [Spirochaetes bacterium]|nr:DJ-1/PfpI family protein [Spirochaetota bacterium]